MKFPMYYHKKMRIFFVLMWAGSSPKERDDIVKVKDVWVYPSERCWEMYRYGKIWNKRIVFIDDYQDFKTLFTLLKTK